MEFTKFIKVKVANPDTGETKEKIRVVSNQGREYDLLTELTQEEIVARRSEILSKIIIKDGPFKPFAVIRMSEVLEEF